MFLIKNIKSILLLVVSFISGLVGYGQGGLEFGNSYGMGNKVNIAISGERGREGTDVIGMGFNQRAPGTRCGFVSDPDLTGWADIAGGMNGDYFMPGTPENGWGIEYGGTAYSNNYDDYEVIADPLKPVTHVVEGDCITIEWEGSVGGMIVNQKYHLQMDEAFYTIEVTMINNTGADQTDVYWYRNVDPDNNQPISGTYTTTNTIVAQPEDDCQKSLVSAESAVPHDSYLGFGALGSNFRVSHGGFSNRDASDIWDGVGGLDGVVGSIEVADQAISLAYKEETMLDGDTINFTMAVVLSADAVESAFSSLYYIDYTSVGGVGGGVISECSPVVDSVTSCNGIPAILSVEGPNDEDYEWTWESEPFDADAPTDGPTIEVAPDETTTYTVTGVPISDCLDGEITKSIVVVFSEGPEISVVDPGPYCEDFDINDLVFEDLNGTVDPNIVFLTEFPDSADQTEPEFVGPMMGPDDDVWLMIGDTVNGCYDVWKVEIDFGGLGAAGADSTIALCGEAGVVIDLHDLIEEGANPLGDFEEETFSGQFNEATGLFTVSGLAGTYVFTYTVEGVDPCPDDEATFTVEVYGQPTADFEYEVDGVSSADGLGSTCIINEVDFIDFSTIPAPATITSWDWDFGGDGTSTDENPSHTFTAIGTYTITLTVTTDDGCTSTFEKEIIIYEEPILDAIFNDPTCNGFTDGSITAFVAGGSGTFEIEITDDEGTVLNAEGSNTANTLGAGTYTINVVDGSGCTAEATITLVDPPALEAFYRIVEPLCYGDEGYVVIDSVVGEADNNAMSYFWAPETTVPNGYEADSVGVFGGEYVLTINDERGCSNVINITINEPDSLYFNEDTGFDPAYCRLFGYQNGNGQVYASASGGTPDYDYVWEDLTTGETTTNTTWGGRNPGDYRITATDDNGCVVTWIVTVDSLNPIADFDVISDDLNTDCKGTAPVDVEFENKSLYYSNPLNPLSDPRFFWNLNSPNGDWQITDDYDQKYDTTYEARGESYIIDVCLVVQNDHGCTDTLCKPVEIFEPIVFPIVNIFTPNGDGNNDIFTFSESAKSISEFQCIIVNRWGIQVGEINDILGGWNGTDMNGDPVTDGVYFYTYTYTADNGEKGAGQGTVNVAGTK